MFELETVDRTYIIHNVLDKGKAMFRMLLFLASFFLLLSCNTPHYIGPVAK